MIAEPYIILEGPKAGAIYWHVEGDRNPGIYFQQYTDFEREKLDVLGIIQIEICPTIGSPKRATGNAFFCSTPRNDYGSVREINYWNRDYIKESESSRLLKRAEFLKTVCEKEGVEWLPKEQTTSKGGYIIPPYYPDEVKKTITEALVKRHKRTEADQQCEPGCAGPHADVNCIEGRYCGCPCHYGDAEFCVRWDREREWRKALLDALIGGMYTEYGNIDHVTPALEALRKRLL